jgi:hypothetical protein
MKKNGGQKSRETVSLIQRADPNPDLVLFVNPFQPFRYLLALKPSLVNDLTK